MNIALYFGSFNPIHIGHLVIAQYIVNHSDVDKLWFVVSPHSPHKSKSSLIDQYKRLYLVNMAISDNAKFKASDIEFKLPTPSYTIDTLTYLKELYPDYNFTIIMGEDNLNSLYKWKNYELILEKYKIIVYKRGNEDSKNELYFHPNITLLDAPKMEISSTAIRQNFKSKISNKYQTLDCIIEEIEKGGYY